MNLFMMNKSQFTLLLILISFSFAGGTVAQTSAIAVAQVTLSANDFCEIDTFGGPVNLTLSTLVAGTAVPTVSNSNMYVRISSLVPGNTNRMITVHITSGTVPLGTRLTLKAALSINANGAGRSGSVVSTPIILTAIDQPLVTGIGSYYTGTGPTDGYRLTYTWGPYNPATDYQLIQATAVPTTLTIVLTISPHDGNN